MSGWCLCGADEPSQGWPCTHGSCGWTEDPPQMWVECDACDGEGYIVRRVTVYEHGCGFPHDDGAEETCTKCHGARGWIEEFEPDQPASFTKGECP